MTYLRTSRAFGHGYGYVGGIGNLGDDLVIDWSRSDSAVLAVQRELQRLGFLSTGTGTSGADGKWGSRTEAAMTAAARYVSWSGAPFTARYDNAQRNRGTVTVPAELLAQLRAAAPAPTGTTGRIGPGPAAPPLSPEEGGGFTIPPVAELEPLPERPLPWWPWALIGGGVLMMGGATIWIMRKPKRATATRRSQMTTVVANKRRRVRMRS
jgi:hypothetical protein